MSPTHYRVHSLADNAGPQIMGQNIPIGGKQPDSSLEKNCTAVAVDWQDKDWKAHKQHTSWITVPCDQRFYATYICQTHRKISYKSNETSITSRSSYVCDKGWFLFDGIPKCYTLLRAPPILSFHVANAYCSSTNSSVLEIDTTRYTESLNRRGKALLGLYRSELYYGKGIILPKHLIYKGIGALLNVWVGRALKKKQQEEVLNMFKNIMMARGADIFIPVRLQESCGFVAYSAPLERVMINDGLHLMKGWSAKLTECDEILKSDVFVCEKPSHLTEKRCMGKHHECVDGTCILAIYLCDTVRDCFDGTDEEGCHSQITHSDNFILLNFKLYLPCAISAACDSASNISLPPLYIHAICDGIPSKAIFHEVKVCLKRNMRTINTANFIRSHFYIYKKYTNTQFKVINLQVFQNFILKNDKNYDTLNTNETVPLSSIKYYQETCEAVGHVITMPDMCKIGLDIYCGPRNIGKVCRDIYCPGMFKCAEYYCIFLSSVCDVQIDCPYGEDELPCANPACPGALRCRGEIRCVSPQQICDGVVNCIYSFDDEVYCEKCPVDCTCDGYLLKCTVQNSLENLRNIAKLFSKGVVLKGNQEKISLDVLFTLSIVYLDISHCGTMHITYSSILHSGYQHILFSDLSNNKL